VLVARKPWLLAPPGAACASWAGHVFLLGRPEGVLERLALSAPVGDALTGTRDTFADRKPQVKGYF
jgi:hypothetical protein